MAFKFPKRPKTSQDGWNAHGFFIRLIVDAFENAAGTPCPVCGRQTESSAWEQAQAVMDALENAPSLKQIRQNMRMFRTDIRRKERDSFDCGNSALAKRGARKPRARRK